jgi:nitrate/TMAO reductase-like tetraheme cytochrome c subunit
MPGTTLGRTDPDMPNPDDRRPRDRRMRSRLGLLLVAFLVLVGAPAAWHTTDVLESDNEFCGACHLSSGQPLHTEKREAFHARPPQNLAARHASAKQIDRPDSPEFRCIDCHGGVGFLGRAKIKFVSAKDSILYLTGRYSEPKEMKWPLGDDDCRQCHAKFDLKGEGFDGEAFHDQPGHNEDLGVKCISCHSVHTEGADADAWFLRPAQVRTRCAQCHIEYRDS